MAAMLKKCGAGNVIIFLLLLVFTIGLNLGIHGALHYDVSHGPGDVTNSNVNVGIASPSPRAGPPQEKLLTGFQRPPLPSATELKPIETNTVPPVATKPPQPVGAPDKSLNEMGVIERFIAQGGKFPILLITCNRPDILKITLNSLLSVIGVSVTDILVVQDGSMEAVSEVVKSRGITVIQNTRGIGLRGGAGSDGASRIATHYKFALTTAFQQYPDAPGVIVVEDDLLFSPDFFEYFHVASPILDQDQSVFALSAWSDNGFIGRVKDPYKLERTDYFPGLGWLISRQLYSNELEPQWPRAHWDHWLRSESINKNREIVHPEVPRTYHNGIKGTFMDLTMHNMYFRDIAYNTDPSVSWRARQAELGRPVYGEALSEPFEAEVAAQIGRCTHARSVEEILSAPVGATLCVWIDVPHEMATSDPPFKPISSFFGLWHEHRRGAHRGMHRFYFHEKLILLLNIKFFSKKMGSYTSFKPKDAVILEPRAFDKRKLANFVASDISSRLVDVPASEPGTSCTDICASKSMQCYDAGFSMLNTCDKMQAHFPCKGCFESLGNEQPAYVITTHTENKGACLFTSEPSRSTCNAFHPSTMRLCPCLLAQS